MVGPGSGVVDTGRTVFREALSKVGKGWGRVQERRSLEYDLLESDEAYLVVFDAPGVHAEDVRVRFLDHTVEVHLERFREFFEGYEMRFPGRGLTLSGTAKLPGDAAVTPTGANATVTNNGTLEVEIPKDESAREVAVVEETDEETDS